MEKVVMQQNPSGSLDSSISYFDFAKKILSGNSLEDKYFSQNISWGSWKSFELPATPGRTRKLYFSEKQIKFPKAPSLNDIEKKAIALHSFANHELLAIEMMAAAVLIYPHSTEDDIRFKRGIISTLKDEQK